MAACYYGSRYMSWCPIGIVKLSRTATVSSDTLLAARNSLMGTEDVDAKLSRNTEVAALLKIFYHVIQHSTTRSSNKGLTVLVDWDNCYVVQTFVRRLAS